VRNIIIGTAKLCSRPPSAGADSREASLDWDGEVRSRTDTQVAMFDAGSFRVQVRLFRARPEIVYLFASRTLS
jgi:hypothetical protein